MPSAADFQTEANARDLVSKYVVLVQEHLGVLQPAPAAGTRQQLAAATYQLHFTVSTVATVRTIVAVDVYTAAQGGSLPLYFLPWCQNAATEMTIPAGGGGPGIFMTSMLSGCTVQVHGTATNPTITHANSRQSYDDAYNQMQGFLGTQGLSAQEVHNGSETRGNSAATGAINTMLPQGVNARTVRKRDYVGKLTPDHLTAAKSRFNETLSYKTWETLSKYEVAKSGAFKPKTGAFVYGLRDVHNQWSFFYQAAVEVDIQVSPFAGYYGDTVNYTMDSAVLGPPARFFP
ncbi:hypothetical protein [Paraburkholderia sp. HD33-4]|uniref:hypothetical protein n=1 Tax=Paraburkholderia sp. HD33-4 TaxID=2883242 RepID=UPI001F3851BD|nr:hypothetical protein [Paraburkholderia sp. HD33-4]